MASAQEKQVILETLALGQRVAEDEPKLEDYFVETPLWRKVIRNEVDIVYGPKGAGKSAIFHLLMTTNRLPSDVQVVPAENPRGTPVFNAIKTEPPPSEPQFVYLWKLYIASLLASDPETLSILKGNDPYLYNRLLATGVLDSDKGAMLKKVLRYVDSVKVTDFFEVDINSNPESDIGLVNADKILGALDLVLKQRGIQVWLLFDRLDSVFDDDPELEENALRALFKTYLDALRHTNIRLKIFLRTDIWQRLARKGFREASHITRSDTIEWPENNIVNLIAKRLLTNAELCNFYNVKPYEVLADYEKQRDFLYKIYPAQVDSGSRKPETIKWLISRVADGTGNAAPRELIHLLNQARDEQIKSLEIGESTSSDNVLFQPLAFKRALPIVSKVRLEQTLYSEHPDLQQYIQLMEGEKASHTIKTLAALWKLSEPESLNIAAKLVEVGFFEVRGERSNPEYWIPFLYRPSLNLIQGKADEEDDFSIIPSS